MKTSQLREKFKSFGVEAEHTLSQVVLIWLVSIRTGGGHVFPAAIT